ncbi:MAG: monofunctional biosynthetic peptidoglycan transglycosylase [Bacteroidia bacterium]|nr:monofunctional biosynthetic peptidoglycan transglycosylase [Bacteroidia bacterium]
MKHILKIIFIRIPLALLLFSVMTVVALKWLPVRITPIMIKRAIEFRQDKDFRTVKEWRDIEDISPELMKAVITSEDNLFCKHHGFDIKAIKEAREEIKSGKRFRGGSTISQQTAKNVFTFHKQTLWRKVVESYYTVLIELIWGKERIMEVYLNVIEVGKGIYGAQAAAETYFGKDADKLTRKEAAAIAVCLPSPLKRNPARPSEYVSKRTAKISKMIPNIIYPEWIERSGDAKARP